MIIISMGNPENVAKIAANLYRKMRMFTGRMNMKGFILDPNIMNLIIDCVVFNMKWIKFMTWRISRLHQIYIDLQVEYLRLERNGVLDFGRM